MKKINSIIFASLLFLTPSFAFAASCFDQFNGAGKKFGDLLDYATCTINNSVIPLLFAVAVVMFILGVLKFFLNSDDEAKKEKGRQFMIWGIVALAVMTSIWGLVAMLGNTFGIKTNALPQVRPNLLQQNTPSGQN